METQTHDLIDEFLHLQPAAQRYQDFARRAEEAGSPHLARYFRAIAASDTYREKLIRAGVLEHAADDTAYFVCPHCGLVFVPEAPEKCPADGTPGAQFEAIR